MATKKRSKKSLKNCPRFTYEGGRQIHRDGKPFISIGREGGTPTEVDSAAKKIAGYLNKSCGGKR